tara:strand:- start:252 stop:821 length:570 start_codon:yes stop_codon:yes gene_type:complete
MLALSSVGFAQQKWTLKDRWRNSIGASAHLLMIRKNVSPAFGVFYNPQINIINKYADFSLAVTMPLTLGAHVKDTWIEKTYFYGHIPAVLEANIGHYATRDFRSDIGMGVGAGYAAQINGADVSTGFVATLAARTWFFRGSITIRYLFHLNLQGIGGYNTHALGVAVNMGNYFNKLTHMNKMSKFQNFK